VHQPLSTFILKRPQQASDTPCECPHRAGKEQHSSKAATTQQWKHAQGCRRVCGLPTAFVSFWHLYHMHMLEVGTLIMAIGAPSRHLAAKDNDTDTGTAVRRGISGHPSPCRVKHCHRISHGEAAVEHPPPGAGWAARDRQLSYTLAAVF